MFVVDREKNRITKIEARTFSELGFKEREHLQEWLEHNSDAFGEEFLFIQKEFDGFDGTRERLDLLAIDKQGNLVVIENKLDDSGHDVTWQVLKYASYCSSLSKQQIKNIYQDYLNKHGFNEDSEENIAEFLGTEDFEEVQLNQTQRIILVAGKYRKEVTSTVLWLLNNYNLKIQCLKATPYTYGDQILLNIEQIIPVKGSEEYAIKMAEKAQEGQSTQDELKERHRMRLEFWKTLLGSVGEQSHLFDNVSPSKDNWISTGSGISGVTYNFTVSRTYARAELYISRNESDENKFIFDKLYEQRRFIEEITGALEWQRLDNRKACRVKCELGGLNLYDEDDWGKMIDFMVPNMMKLEEGFREPLRSIGFQLKEEFQEIA